MKALFSDHNQPNIDDFAADQLLDNILSASGLPPNSVPLSSLRNQANYRKKRFALQRILALLSLIGLFILPLFFVHPSLTLVDATKSSPGSSLLYEATIKPTTLPITNVAATMDGVPISTIKTNKRTYAIQPTTNGTLKVTVTLASGQSDSKEVQISTNDTTAPTIISHDVTDTEVTLYLSDDSSGIDYDSVVATDSNGVSIKPQSVDPEKGTITFAYPDTSLNIYISDNSGNTLQTIMTVK